MHRSRIILGTLMAATLALTAAPAAARPTSAKMVLVQIDIAAIPAYPSADQARHQHQPRAAARRALDANGTAARRQRASQASPEPRHGQIGSGIVRSGKTGATARVAPQYAGKFQAYIDDLESQGATVRFMGGYRKGPCWAGGLHPCGRALDVCQTARGIVDRRCGLPSRRAMISTATRHGLTEGGIWCHSDRGHVQVGMTAGPCGKNLYAAVGEFHAARSRQ